MAMRVATMGPMTPVDTSPSVGQQENLFRKLVLLLLLITAAVLWTVLLFKKSANFPLLLSTFFVDASLGLIAGFGTRFLLRRRDGFVRFLTAVFITLLGMIMIGSLTNSVLGIGPIKLEGKFAEQLNEIDFNQSLLEQIQFLQIGSRPLLDISRMDWADPVHFGVSVLMMLLSHHAWSRATPTTTLQPIEVVEVIALPAPTPSPRSTTRARRVRRSTTSSNGGAHVQRTANELTHLRPSPLPQPRTRSNNGSRSTVVKKIKDPVVKPKRKRSRHKPQIQFAIVEEHRCPYCLDTVARSDPRGVEECKVCHTLHHADCWAITGVCQVPHLNN